jgi:peptide/nickel transport system permease protein
MGLGDARSTAKERIDLSRYLVNRLSQAAFLIVGMLLITFIVIRIIPGDPAKLMSDIPELTDAMRDKYRKALGIDKPLGEQLALYVKGLFVGDLGTSFIYQEPVNQLIFQPYLATLKLAVFSELLVVLLGFGLAIVASQRPNGLLDRACTAATNIFQCFPTFWFALMLMLVVCVQLRWLPSMSKPTLKGMLLPCLTLIIVHFPAHYRMGRSSMLDVVHQDYIKTSRAFGIGRFFTYYVYALRNASINMMNVAGMNFGALIGGTAIVEIIFSYPGIGYLAIRAMGNRDYPLMQGIVILTTSSLILVNLLVDLLYVSVDPRIRMKG